MRSVTRLFAALLLLVVFAAPARAEKSLHWRALDVSARLDADGVLHVVERHAMVFTGDWNGGERVFRLFPGQQLTFEALKRVDPRSGVEQDLVHGDLSGVDRYAFTTANTLRWRSRLPSDPPFDNTELDYLISYRLSGILLKRGNTYTLDHNFALPEASQTIETFSVDLDLDPVWTAAPGLVRRRTAGPLPPGSDVVVHADLAYTGAAVPASVRTGTSTTAQLVFFAALLGAVAVIGAAFIRRETGLGRFVPIAGAEAVGAAWLDQHVFNLRPEEAGALWDDTVGPPEVAAVLARLTAAKKITTWTTDGELSMRLNEPLDSFDGYEKALLTGLFFGKHTETSTSEIKAHYKAEGFDPSAKIKPGLLHSLSGHPDFQDTAPVPSRWPTLALFAAALALFGVFGPGAALEDETTAWSAMWAVALWLVGLIAARAYQARVQRPGWWAVSFAWVPAVFLLGAVGRIGSASTSPVLLLAALCLLQVAIVNNIFNVARTRQGPNKLARRRELVAARRFFARELKRPQPQMKDAWFPWLVAFGLGPKVDRWFRAYGGTAAVHTGGSSMSTSSSSAGSSSSGGGFTGGGGMSGGGGASGSWTVAAGALAAGVSAPSSSGGSSGGGGGGSSGGGGGGGW